MWESHPEIRRVCKPLPDPIYPTYVIGGSDKVGEEIRVTAVTKPKSTSDQMEELLRRLLAGMVVTFPGWQRSVVERKTVNDPGGGGGGFAARISSNVRPQDPGGGTARIAIPREGRDVEMRSSYVSSVVQPQSVPSRISVVRVQETEVRGAGCLVPGPVDKAVRSLAGVMYLSSGTGRAVQLVL